MRATIRCITVALAFAGLASGQTRVKPEDIAAASASTARVLVLLPTGFAAVAELDASLVLENVGSRLMLRVAVPASPQSVAQLFKPSAQQAVYPLTAQPVAGTLRVYRNGLLQAQGEDYNYAAASNEVTFTAVSMPEAGHIIQLLYQRKS